MRWLMVDKLIEAEPGKRAVGVRCFSRSEPLFMDHFSFYPIVPGVVQIEMIAQTGGKCIRLAHPELMTVLGSVKSAKFYKPIEPGSQCIIKVEITALRKQHAIAQGVIEVDGKKVSEAEILYGIIPNLAPANHVDPVIEDWKKGQRA